MQEFFRITRHMTQAGWRLSRNVTRLDGKSRSISFQILGKTRYWGFRRLRTATMGFAPRPYKLFEKKLVQKLFAFFALFFLLNI